MIITKKKDKLNSMAVESPMDDPKTDLPRMIVLAARGAASFSPGQLAELSKASRLTVHEALSRLNNKKLISLCRDAELLGITRRATIDIDEELISGMPYLRGIAIHASGYDWIDLEALGRRNIALAILPDYSTQTVAEHTWGMILTMSRRLHLSDRVTNGELASYISLRGWELADKTLGIIGFGRIGQAVARAAKGFSMRVIYYDKQGIKSDSGIAVDFDEALSSADVVVLACNHERGAPPVIDSSAIAKIKHGAYLINPARPALVDHDAVFQAIKDKRLAGYAVDERVFSKAQLAAVEHGRIFQTGHTAWYSNEAIERGIQCWVDNLVALARNHPVNVINIDHHVTRRNSRGGLNMRRATWVTGIVMVILFLACAIAFIKNNSGQDNPQKINTRFFDYGNGTVLDTKTGLMWAAYDNGTSTTWQEAKQYCEKYIGGGYADWRMPTVEELAGLYDENEPGYRPECAVYDWKVYLTNKIRLTGGSAWTLEDHGAEAECFLFDYGCRSLMFKSVNFIMRALPVRDGLIY